MSITSDEKPKGPPARYENGRPVPEDALKTHHDDHAAKTHQDGVNHPAHYNAGRIEVIDAIEDWSLGFHEGNVVKYVARAKYKGNQLEDLKKAKWYLDRRIMDIEMLREGKH